MLSRCRRRGIWKNLDVLGENVTVCLKRTVFVFEFGYRGIGVERYYVLYFNWLRKLGLGRLRSNVLSLVYIVGGVSFSRYRLEGVIFD